MKDVFKVSFLPVSNCFFYLNEKTISKYRKNMELGGNCIKIEFGDNFDNFTYSSLSCHPVEIADDRIGLDALYGELLGIRENDELLISMANASLLAEARVRLKDDLNYELTEKNISYLEESILNQVKIITVGKEIPIRVFSNIVIYLKVVELCPKYSFGELQQRTNLVILTPSEMDEADSRVEDTVNFKCSMIGAVMDLLKNSRNQNLKEKNNEWAPSCGSSPRNEMEKYSLEFHEGSRVSTFRIAPMTYAPRDVQPLIAKNCALSSRLPISMTVHGSCCFKIFCAVKLKDESSSTDVLDMNNVAPYGNHVLTNIICFSDPLHQSRDILYVQKSVMKALGAKFGSTVFIERVKPGKTLTGNNEVVFPSDEIFKTPSIFPGCMQKIFENVFQTIIDNVRFNQKINTMIIGGTGSGKTELVEALETYLSDEYVFVKFVVCKKLRRMKLHNLEKNLTDSISLCCLNQPSVLILDDLDSLIMEGAEDDPYSCIYSTRIAALITQLITSYQSLNDIFFIATGSDLNTLKVMSTDRGLITFEAIHEISELTMSERAFVLNGICQNSNCNICADPSLIEYVATRTKGYNVQDLADLVELAEFKALLRTNSEEEEIIRIDFELALAEKVPLSLYDVQLQKKPLTKWEDIGGMEESKNILKEMFEWPVKYQELYKSCPLRLQCGVLLYGAPGTGKTLIAGAVANEFELNFISIKGPEILSKYIGASEQGLRDLFSRAKRAQPCLVFFDEFDSLARRRGNSNEGVNDRVVNQLLTELDGVEELTGVYIMAASSRPDLIDPAVLRPGRIDKIVQCTLPNKEERLAILKVLSRKMKLSDDVNLEEISTKTDGYSGADLKAVLNASQAALIKEIRNFQDENVQFEVILKQSHLLTGLRETSPSLSEEMRQSYSLSYEDFISSTNGTLFEEDTGGQRTTFRQRAMFA